MGVRGFVREGHREECPTCSKMNSKNQDEMLIVDTPNHKTFVIYIKSDHVERNTCSDQRQDTEEDRKC